MVDSSEKVKSGIGQDTPEEAVPELEILEVPTVVAVSELAVMMDVEPVEVIKHFMRHGHMFAINDVVEHDIAALITPVFGFSAELPSEEKVWRDSMVPSNDDEDQSKLQTRPPVVTILGHVDHGKTTLLDSIRKSKVVDKEAGSITQHIGAYQVEFNGNVITFLDTPGHEAFTAMRARGARITDIVVLVVAADDGIMPQTIEAINHAKAASVPIVVAINKVDRAEADSERVKRQLSENDLLVEDWGGDVIAIPLSALNGEGVSELLENILVLAEISDFKANPDRLATGIVVEAKIDKSKGSLVTVLVQTGTLRVGDNVVAGNISGRIRAMLGDDGERLKEAVPSTPVELMGLNGIPDAGEQLVVLSDEKSAKETIQAWEREKHSEKGTVSLEGIRYSLESGEVKSLDLIIKTDVQGSLEPIVIALQNLNTDEYRVNIIHAASGAITESDILLAVASKAIIIGFNRRPEPGASILAVQRFIDIRFYDVIYALLDDVEMALKGLLPPKTSDVLEGYGTVRAVFSLGRTTKIAGIYINEGLISRGSEIHVLRSGEIIFSGKISSLKHFKNDVREIRTGLEGGIVLDGFHQFQEGDVIESHITQTVE